MVPLPGDGNAGPSLDNVTLVDFVANPTHLGPFESSLLSWKVNAPAGVQIELSGTPVAKVGAEPVEPPSTQNYVLFAKALGASEVLGGVVVTVDLSQCRLAQLSFLDAIIRAGILSHRETLPSGAYFREDPKVTVTPGQIQIHLSLGKSIYSWLPDVNIDMDMSFGLTLEPDVRGRGLGAIRPRVATRLAAANESDTASLTAPWYVNLFTFLFSPPLALALAVALASAEDGVRANAPGIVQTVVDGLDADFHPAGFEGLVKHTVTIGVDDKNIPFLEANWCPPPSQVIVAPNPSAGRGSSRLSRRSGPSSRSS